MKKIQPNEFWILGNFQETAPLSASLQPFERLEAWELQIPVVRKSTYDELFKQSMKLRKALIAFDKFLQEYK